MFSVKLISELFSFFMPVGLGGNILFSLSCSSFRSMNEGRSAKMSVLADLGLKLKMLLK